MKYTSNLDLRNVVSIDDILPELERICITTLKEYSKDTNIHESCNEELFVYETIYENNCLMDMLHYKNNLFIYHKALYGLLEMSFFGILNVKYSDSDNVLNLTGFVKKSPYLYINNIMGFKLIKYCISNDPDYKENYFSKFKSSNDFNLSMLGLCK